MSLTKNIDSYADVERVFRTAQLNPNGCSVRMVSNKAAQRWRMRAYHFRKLWADVYSESNRFSSDPATRQLGYDHKSPWDHFVLLVEDDYIIVKPEEMKILEIIPADGMMLEDNLSVTEVLDIVTGPAAPLVSVTPGIKSDEDDKFAADKPLF